MFKVVNGQLQSYIKIKRPHFVQHSLFIPKSNRFLVYDGSYSLSEYVIEGTVCTLNQFTNLNLDVSTMPFALQLLLYYKHFRRQSVMEDTQK